MTEMHGDPWTTQADQELRDWAADGRSNRAMAVLTGRTEAAIARRKSILSICGGSDRCLRCDVELPPRRHTGRPAKYCSKACSWWDWYEKKVGHHEKPIKRVCAHCEQSFVRVTIQRLGQASIESAYCSRTCSKAAWYLRERRR